MRFVLQNPIVRSQRLEKVEQKFQGAYDGFFGDLRSDATHKIYGICF